MLDSSVDVLVALLSLAVSTTASFPTQQ
jgi:hypothetical protein